MEELQYYLAKAKNTYSLALKNLEDISEEIHEMRRSRDSLDILLDKREEGVGAETPYDDISCRGASIIEENFGCGSSLSSITTSNTGQIYGLKVAVLTKDVDDWQLSLTGESSGSKDGTLTSAEDGGPRNTAECESLRVANNVAFQKDNLMDEQEQCDDNEMQKSSLKKVISSSSSKNGNIVQSFESEHTVSEELKNLRETKESKWEKATELETLPEREETIVCGCEAQCVDPSSQQEPKTVELVCSHKETTDVRANEESERERAVKDNEAENFEIEANSGAFVIDEQLAKPNSETESRVRSVTCGEVDEMAPELGASDSIVRQHDVDSRVTDDPGSSNKLTNPITEAESKVGSVMFGEVDQMAPELGVSDSIVGQHDVDSRATDDPGSSNKLTNPIPEAGSKVGSVTCGEVNEMAPKLGVSDSIVGQHDVDSRVTDDPDTSNKLTNPITEAESRVRSVTCGEVNEMAPELGASDSIVGQHDVDSRVTDDPGTSNKLTNPIPEAESRVRSVTCGEVNEMAPELGVSDSIVRQHDVDSRVTDDPGTSNKLTNPIPEAESKVDSVTCGEVDEMAPKLGVSDSIVGQHDVDSRVIDDPGTSNKLTNPIPEAESRVRSVTCGEVNEMAPELGVSDSIVRRHDVDSRATDDPGTSNKLTNPIPEAGSKVGSVTCGEVDEMAPKLGVSDSIVGQHDVDSRVTDDPGSSNKLTNPITEAGSKVGSATCGEVNEMAPELGVSDSIVGQHDVDSRVIDDPGTSNKLTNPIPEAGSKVDSVTCGEVDEMAPKLGVSDSIVGQHDVDSRVTDDPGTSNKLTNPIPEAESKVGSVTCGEVDEMAPELGVSDSIVGQHDVDSRATDDPGTSNKLTNPIPEAESRVRSVTCGEVNEMAPELGVSDSIVRRHDVDSRATDDPGTSNKLTNPIPEAESKVDSVTCGEVDEMAPKLGVSDSIVRRHDVDSRATDDPGTSNKLTNPIPEAESRVRSVTCGEVNEMAPELGVSDSIVRQHDVDSRVTDDPGTSNKLTNPIPEAESKVDSVTCGEVDEMAPKLGVSDSIVGQHDVDSRVIDDPGTSNKLTNPIPEAESRVRSVTCGEVNEMAPELGVSDSIVRRHDVDSRATDDPGTSNKLTNPIPEAGSKVGSVTCGEVDEMAPKLGVSDSIVGQHDVDSRVTDDPGSSNKLTNPIPEAGSKVGSATCGEVNEMAPELGVSHSIVGQHDVDSRVIDDPGSSNKLTNPIPEAGSKVDSVTCGEVDEMAPELGVSDSIVGQHDVDSRATDDPGTSNKLTNPIPEAESKVDSVTCGEVDEMAPKLGVSDSIVGQHDVDSRATDDPGSSNKLTNPITEAGSKVGSVTCGEVNEMAPKLGVSDSIVGQHDVDSRVTDDPGTSNKLTNPITEAESKVGSVMFGEVDEMAPELGASDSIVGQHDVDSRATDDPDTSNKLTNPITEAESEQDLMCGRQDQKACEREEIIEGVVGHQDDDSRVTDDPDISNKLTNPAITEAESEPDLTCGRPDQKACEREEIVEGVAVQQLVGSGACDNPGICDDLNKPGSVYS